MPSVDRDQARQQGTARAWIAIGHRAYGRLLAIGNVAVAPIALGTVALGVVSFGVIACGAISIGVISIAALAGGVVAIGGVCLSVLSLGIIAIGVMLLGVVAAKGQLAIAGKYAVGQVAIAQEANTDAANKYLSDLGFVQRGEQLLLQVAHFSQTGTIATLAAAAILAGRLFLVAYQKR